MCHFHDEVTCLSRLFEEVDQAYETLSETKDQLVHAEKFAAMGLLAAEIAHEINNPASFVISNLSVMVDYTDTLHAFARGLSEVALDASADATDTREAIEELESEHEIDFVRDDLESLLSRSLAGMQRIHRIVQDLRFFSTDTGHEPSWISLRSLLEATVNLAKHEAKYRAGLVLEFDDPPQIYSDPNRLSQVFLNLLINAAQAIDEGSADENEIRLIAGRVGDDAVFVRVEDTGRGIEPGKLDEIFEPFYTTKAPGEGTGLGLSISRDIVRSLGGEITVESSPGEGSSFEVILPIRAERFSHDEPPETESTSRPGGHLAVEARASTGSESDEGSQS